MFYCLGLLILIITSIELSTLVPRTATLVYGSTQVLKGNPALFRLIHVTPKHITKTAYKAVAWRLESPGKDVLASGRDINGILFEPKVFIPKESPDRLTLFFTIDSFDEEEIRIDLRASTKAVPKSLFSFISTDEIIRYKKAKSPPPPVEFAFESGFPILSFTQQGFAWSPLKDDQPSATLQTTDSNVLALAPAPTKLNITPELKTGDIVLSHSFNPENEKKKKTYLNWRAKRPKVLIQGIERLPGPAPTTISYKIQALPTNQPVIVDLWAGTTLIDTASHTASRKPSYETFSLPNNLPLSPLTLVAYRSLLIPEAASSWSITWPGISTKASIDDTLTPWIDETPGFQGPDRGVTEAALSDTALLKLYRLRPLHYENFLIHSSIEPQQRRYEALKKTLRTRVNYGLGFYFGMGAALLLFWMTRSYKARLKAIRGVFIDSAWDQQPTHEEMSPDTLARLTAFGGKHSFFGAMIALGGFCVFLYWLLHFVIRWDLPL
ncbi:MAG: hypothetical protein VYA34_00205 [Myxococcota bacterium]|nr:hypothetical protein [Myxococcota bacterium]